MVPLSFFLSVCPSHPGLPNTCLWWKNINRIARFLSINCCLTVPAKHRKAIPFFLFIVFSWSLPRIQWASVPSSGGSPWFFALPWTESQLCSPELKWIPIWGVSHCPPLLCYPHTEWGDMTESQRSHSWNVHISACTEVLSSSNTTEWRFGTRLRKASLILATFVKFIYLTLERSKGTLQRCPGCSQHSPLLNWKHRSAKQQSH